MEIIETIRVTQPNGRIRLKVRYKCSKCGKISETHKDNIKHQHTGLCRSCSCKETAFKQRGKESKLKGKERKTCQGKCSKNWKGGKYTNLQGYVMIKIKNGRAHNDAGWNHYKPEHIYIMEKQLKRKLIKGECVHHINGDKADNRLENLVLIDNNRNHRMAHHSLQKIGYMLYQQGKIIFDRSTNEYKMKDE